jgi:hypothetical protein
VNMITSKISYWIVCNDYFLRVCNICEKAGPSLHASLYAGPNRLLDMTVDCYWNIETKDDDSIALWVDCRAVPLSGLAEVASLVENYLW